MTNRVPKTLAAAVFSMLLMGGSASAQVRFGRVDPPAQRRVERVIPPSPGLQDVWVGDYWQRYGWPDSYWVQAPYDDPYWSVPQFSDWVYVEAYSTEESDLYR